MAQRLLHRPRSSDPLAQLFPRVMTGLVGLYLAASAWRFEQSLNARTSASVVALVAVYLAVHGLWFPRLRLVQAAAAVGLAVSTLVFGVRGPAMWSAFAVAAVLLVLAWLTPDPRRL